MSRREGSFSLNVPEEFNWARDIIGKWAAGQDHRAMLWVGPDGEPSAYHLWRFRQAGQPGGRRPARRGCAARATGWRSCCPRVPEWWEAVLGIMKLGAVSMPGTILLTPKDIAYRISASEAARRDHRRAARAEGGPGARASPSLSRAHSGGRRRRRPRRAGSTTRAWWAPRPPTTAASPRAAATPR